MSTSMGIGVLTHSTRNVLFTSRQQRCINTILFVEKNSGRMRARKNGIHSQYAGEAPDVREAEQDAEDYRHCKRERISMSTLHHSFFLPAALITNTSCELIVPIQCTLQTPNDGVSFASRNSSCFFPNPRNRALQKNALYMRCNAVQCNAMPAGRICVFSVPGKCRPAKTCASS